MTGSLRDPLHPLKGAQRQVHLIDSPIRSFLMANILPDHFFVATCRRDKIAPVQKCCPTKFRFLSEYRPLGRAIDIHSQRLSLKLPVRLIVSP